MLSKTSMFMVITIMVHHLLYSQEDQQTMRCSQIEIRTRNSDFQVNDCGQWEICTKHSGFWPERVFKNMPFQDENMYNNENTYNNAWNSN